MVLILLGDTKLFPLFNLFHVRIKKRRFLGNWKVAAVHAGRCI